MHLGKVDDRGNKEFKMSGIREEIGKHWVWILSMVFGLGGAFVLQAVQGKNISENSGLINISREKIVNLEQADIRLAGADERAMLKLESIDNGIKDLKVTVERLDGKMNKMNERVQVQFDEMKKILYKPVVGGIDGTSVVSRVSSL